MGSIGIVGPLCMWIAWLLLFFASLSLPIINGIKLMTLHFTIDGKVGSLAFGIWGACLSDNFKPSELGYSGVTFDMGQCTGRGLGLTTRVVDRTKVADVVLAGATWSLVLHPVACAAVVSAVFILIVTWLVSLIGLPRFMYERGQRMNSNLKEFISLFFSLFPLGLYIVATILTTTVFILDMIIVGVAIQRAKENHQAESHVTFGAIPWLTFVAMLLVWIGQIEAYRSSFTFGPGRKMTHRPVDW